MSLEHHLGIYHEQTLQQWALHFRPLILFANYYYGSFHFIVTIFAGVFLYRHYSDDYPRFRNTLAIATALALVGFTLYPLAPPRMFPGLRRHAVEGPRVLVVQLRRHAEHLEPVRGDAERAHRVVDVVRDRARRRGSRTATACGRWRGATR